MTDADGRFALDAPANAAALVVKVPGYEMRRVPVDDEVRVTLKPKSIRAAYLTYYGIAEASIRNRVLELVDRTELNAVVIDVKGDRGLIPYRTEVPAALEAGALGPVIIKDFDGMLRSFRERGIYTIARVVAFKDTVLAHHRPDLAVIDTRTGKPWIDNEKLAWVDPFREEVWDYLIAIAREAAAKGFDEVQFDYVRFPTDGRLSAAVYSQPNSSATRLPAIAGFLAKARRELGPTGVFLAADVFGYTAFNANDTDIGQRVEELAPHLDYICPMVYPSGYHLGIPGYRNPVRNPYEVVRESVRLIRQRSQHTPCRCGPGSRTSATTRSTGASSARARSGPRSREPPTAAASASCSGTRATTTRLRPSCRSRPPRRGAPAERAPRRPLRRRRACPGRCRGRRAPRTERARARDDPRVPQDRPARGPVDAHAGKLPPRPPSALGARLSARAPQRLSRWEDPAAARAPRR